MEILKIILAAAISLSGLLVGLVLARIAREEIKQGIKYFIFLKRIFLLLALIFVLYSYHLNIWLFIFLGLLIALAAIKIEIKTEMAYCIFAVLFILSLSNANLLILTSSIIFMYGLPVAALIKAKRR